MSQFVLTENTKLQDLPITDNFMFQQVMKNEVICKQFLEKVLKIKIVKLNYVALEKTFEHFPDSKGIRLDLYVEDLEKEEESTPSKISAWKTRTWN